MTIKMNKCIFILLSLNLRYGFMYRHGKPVAQSVWKDKCSPNSRILNDCNWCRCIKASYSCEARVCEEVDMFGHFNDAIRDIHVGIEGHGVWRKGQQACEPGVPYQRGELLCICTQDGSWPSSVCRDTFRVLHNVEEVTDVKNFKDNQCEPGKLYLLRCNVCFCPADGNPNPKFCTKKTCFQDDPIFETPKHSKEADEIYAQCDINTKYKLGCKNCECLRNNRLVCGNCSTDDEAICDNRKPGEMFKVKCNTCQCDDRGMIYCTMKNCLESLQRSKDDIDEKDFEIVEAPMNDIQCVEGTKYKKGCNTCYCFKAFGVKKYGCTVEKCTSSKTINHGCVKGSTYEINCLICQCVIYNDKKVEICVENPKCKKDSQELSVANWAGYCEPMHRFKKDCNLCQCLADGITAYCTANRCEKRTEYEIDNNLKPIEVEIVPIVKDIGSCEKGSTFKIDCNLCLCLANSDVICTTEDCSKND